MSDAAPSFLLNDIYQCRQLAFHFLTWINPTGTVRCERSRERLKTSQNMM